MDRIKLIKLPTNLDSRGKLTSVEGNIDIPFEIKRVFYLYGIKKNRGGHAHINTDQVLVVVSGSLRVTLSDGINKELYIMNDATRGLYIPRMIFVEMTEFSKETVCLILASTHYNIKNSLRTWDAFINRLNNKI